MASITIRNIDDRTKQALKLQAVRHGRSMEEHARCLLRTAVEPDRASLPSAGRLNLAEEIARIMEAAGGGIELEPYPRSEAEWEALQKRREASPLGDET